MRSKKRLKCSESMYSPPPPYEYVVRKLSALKSKDGFFGSRKVTCCSPPPPPRTTKRDIWWMVCPPTFGAPYTKLARLHLAVLFTVGLVFLWLSFSVPSYMAATNNKMFNKEKVGHLLFIVGSSPLPFCLSGYIAFRANRPNFFVPTAIFYQVILMFSCMPFIACAMMTVSGILWMDIEVVVSALIPMFGAFLILSFLFHGYRIIIRVRNDMHDDYLDANTHLIPDSEPESEVEEIE